MSTEKPRTVVERTPHHDDGLLHYYRKAEFPLAVCGHISPNATYGERHVFLSRNHARLTSMGMWQLLNRRARRAGLSRRIYPHMLRHTFATHTLKSGCDARTLQLFLGHARLETVQVYVQLDDAWLRDAHKRFHPRG